MYQQKETLDYTQEEQREEDRNESERNSLFNSLSAQLSDYIISHPIGSGAGSLVVKVQSIKTKKEYAIKVVDKQSSYYKSAYKRLKNEIDVHLGLKHKNIVKMIKSFEDQENLYLVMEYCEGGDLFHYLKHHKKLSENEAKRITFELVEGLKYLHDKQIIHRDLKLGNVLLSADHTVKICDFGLAARLNGNEQEKNTICGTPNYISPEILNKQPYGMKIDCWSFGCILYALIVGHPPFQGQDVVQTLKKVTSQEQFFELPNNISSHLKDLLVNIINWNQDSRFTIDQILNHPFYDDMRKKSAKQKQEEEESLSFFNSIRSVKGDDQRLNAHKNLNNEVKKIDIKYQDNFFNQLDNSNGSIPKKSCSPNNRSDIGQPLNNPKIKSEKSNTLNKNNQNNQLLKQLNENEPDMKNFQEGQFKKQSSGNLIGQTEKIPSQKKDINYARKNSPVDRTDLENQQNRMNKQVDEGNMNVNNRIKENGPQTSNLPYPRKQSPNDQNYDNLKEYHYLSDKRNVNNPHQINNNFNEAMKSPKLTSNQKDVKQTFMNNIERIKNQPPIPPSNQQSSTNLSGINQDKKMVRSVLYSNNNQGQNNNNGIPQQPNTSAISTQSRTTHTYSGYDKNQKQGTGNIRNNSPVNNTYNNDRNQSPKISSMNHMSNSTVMTTNQQAATQHKNNNYSLTQNKIIPLPDKVQTNFIQNLNSLNDIDRFSPPHNNSINTTCNKNISDQQNDFTSPQTVSHNRTKKQVSFENKSQIQTQPQKVMQNSDSGFYKCNSNTNNQLQNTNIQRNHSPQIRPQNKQSNENLNYYLTKKDNPSFNKDQIEKSNIENIKSSRVNTENAAQHRVANDKINSNRMSGEYNSTRVNTEYNSTKQSTDKNIFNPENNPMRTKPENNFNKMNGESGQNRLNIDNTQYRSVTEQNLTSRTNEEKIRLNTDIIPSQNNAISPNALPKSLDKKQKSEVPLISQISNQPMRSSQVQLTQNQMQQQQHIPISFFTEDRDVLKKGDKFEKAKHFKNQASDNTHYNQNSNSNINISKEQINKQQDTINQKYQKIRVNTQLNCDLSPSIEQLNSPNQPISIQKPLSQTKIDIPNNLKSQQSKQISNGTSRQITERGISKSISNMGQFTSQQNLHSINQQVTFNSPHQNPKPALQNYVSNDPQTYKPSMQNFASPQHALKSTTNIDNKNVNDKRSYQNQDTSRLNNQETSINSNDNMGDFSQDIPSTQQPSKVYQNSNNQLLMNHQNYSGKIRNNDDIKQTNSYQQKQHQQQNPSNYNTNQVGVAQSLQVQTFRYNGTNNQMINGNLNHNNSNAVLKMKLSDMQQDHQKNQENQLQANIYRSNQSGQYQQQSQQQQNYQSDQHEQNMFTTYLQQQKDLKIFEQYQSQNYNSIDEINPPTVTSVTSGSSNQTLVKTDQANSNTNLAKPYLPHQLLQNNINKRQQKIASADSTACTNASTQFLLQAHTNQPQPQNQSQALQNPYSQYVNNPNIKESSTKQISQQRASVTSNYPNSHHQDMPHHYYLKNSTVMISDSNFTSPIQGVKSKSRIQNCFKTEASDYESSSTNNHNNTANTLDYYESPRLNTLNLLLSPDRKPETTNSTATKSSSQMKNLLSGNKDNSSCKNNSNNTSKYSRLSPLKVGRIAPNRIQTQNGTIEITENKEFILKSIQKNITMIISPDGRDVTLIKDEEPLNKRQFTIDRLPEKYIQLYEYCKKICQTLTKTTLEKSPKVKLENEDGQFILYENKFEGAFTNGYTVNYKLNSQTLEIQTNKYAPKIIFDLQKDLKHASKEMKLLVQKTQKIISIITSMKS